MTRTFEIAAALFAVVAAVFWFLSAYGELPQIVSYWDTAPVDEAAIMTSSAFPRFESYEAALSSL